MARLRLFAVLAVVLLTATCSPLRARQIPAPFQPSFKDKPAALEKIEPPLRDHLERSTSEELIPIVLIMERQVAKEEKARLFSQVDTEDRYKAKQQKRKLLIQELKRVARADQREILELLHAWQAEGQVKHVRPLWLANAIGLEARRSAIEQLNAVPGIWSIHLDIPRMTKGAVEWGVTRIRADQVWPTGYDGSGVIVAVLDTGVRYQHPDLQSRMWINAKEDKDGDGQFTAADNDRVDDDGNGFADDVVGWSFSLSKWGNDPVDEDNHGTHVAGIVAGDGTKGTQTGVAPGARIMALRETDSIQLSTQFECWMGMEYALDNGADIVNFSSGWRARWTPAYAVWRLEIENLMDAGVLFVTITHNDENDIGSPDNVRTPGRVPLALTAGATTDKEALACFSNQGPVTWQTVDPYLDYPWPPGLRKPDVTAPGVDVVSTVRPDPIPTRFYGSMSGTSMAAPHAAGLAALLLDKDPSLSPYDLKLIIEETSVNPSAPGPDNFFGWGRIDALAAIRYRLNLAAYDLAAPKKEIWVDNNDDGVPDKPVPMATNHLYARILNLGGQAVSDVEVRFYSIGVGGGGCGGSRKHIGTYRVPTLGPSGSRHAAAVAVIHWVPAAGPWCVGIEIAAPNPPNPPERRLSNNTASQEL
ncbi:MAG TPA: S8 family serine peptidase [Thermoanaerobaculia bacterium]|nr:S8 family serine peptidase [Thermoanaerobaculia bacterium]